jgi:PD-(D/E)XK nuclease superfamily
MNADVKGKLVVNTYAIGVKSVTASASQSVSGIVKARFLFLNISFKYEVATLCEPHSVPGRLDLGPEHRERVPVLQRLAPDLHKGILYRVSLVPAGGPLWKRQGDQAPRMARVCRVGVLPVRNPDVHKQDDRNCMRLYGWYAQNVLVLVRHRSGLCFGRVYFRRRAQVGLETWYALHQRMMSTPRRVVLKASEVAAIIGRNKYKPRQEVFNELWKKYSPATFTGQTKKDRAEEILSTSREVRSAMAAALNIKAENSLQVQSIYKDLEAKVNSDSKLNASQKTEVLDHIRSKVYTTHGTRSEDKTADKVTMDENVKLIKDNSFYSLDVCTLGDTAFVVTGKIDRIEERPDGSRVLVEIKNRTNRLFGRVVEYEMIQVQVYLQMLGLVHARLVEQYNTQVLSHDITRDEEMWSNEILPGLEGFCQELYSTWNSTQ